MPFAPLPDTVRRNVLDWHGDRGRRWLEDLPATVDRLTSAWDLHPVGDPFPGGSTAYVLPLDRADGTAAVLKVDLVDDETRSEPTALRAYDGEGAVRLLDYDPASGALLLERARPGTPLLSHDFPGLDERAAARERIALACGLFRRLWRVPVPDPGLPPLPATAGLLKDWSERFALTAERTPALAADLALGLDLCEALADPPELGIANRDNHMSNVLTAQREPWLLIDPKPVLAERAFDGAFFLFKQQFHGPLGGGELLDAVAGGLGADRERVRAWAMLWTVAEIAGAWSDDDLAAKRAVLDAIRAA
ncbi:aminoglycoside phosphotransferase family protein [Glycomyces terrestris]|uniref:Kinase n=1 Tax=Glycomyces terrestris TaxID=2493553 RepID=A0A426UUZ8_9ACTN|nr:aminoglycoside phosphotransferase family protein [Glycomyces terrestris]RRR98140.1 kinase [Glycomyces terrestris]